jgi:hypothetical protein
MMRRASIGIAFLALSHLAFANVSSALAQAGSTGGTIGKQDKSISGGESAVEPHTPMKSRPKGQRPIGRGTSDQSSEVSVAGSWRWIADCNSGHWEGQFNLVETSRGQFNGNLGADGTISDGHINGTRVSFTRTWPFHTQYWKGQLTAGRIKGTLSGNENCSWEASRK